MALYHTLMDGSEVKHNLHRLAADGGASAFGVCDVGDLVEKFHPEIRETARNLPFAVSIGIHLQKAVMATIVDRPNEIYKAHYRTINARLDDIILRLAAMLSDNGYRAMPIPASRLLYSYPRIGHVNHREIAAKAGLGWRGKNNLLVSPVYGGRLRLATLLTDLPMPPDPVVDTDCGACRACLDKCPAGAIGSTPEEFDLDKCRRQVTAFSKQNNFGQLICGLCLTCCPQDAKNGENRG